MNTKQAQDIARSVLHQVKFLTHKERKIIGLRFGLLDGINYTLHDVGKEFGVTRERIRQIEAKALSLMASAVQEKLSTPILDNNLTLE